jgi:hypothetical protein
LNDRLGCDRHEALRHSAIDKLSVLKRGFLSSPPLITYYLLEGNEQNGFFQLSYSDRIRRVRRERFLLKNPDLMAMTFSHLKNDASYRCLLNAALTCKDFLDVALDALWEELGSFVPLLILLPALQVEDEAYVCANVHVFLYGLNLSLGP